MQFSTVSNFTGSNIDNVLLYLLWNCGRSHCSRIPTKYLKYDQELLIKSKKNIPDLATQGNLLWGQLLYKIC